MKKSKTTRFNEISVVELKGKFIKKAMLILANFNQALEQQNYNHSIFMLQMIYLERMPLLFEFVAENMPEKIIIGFLRPVWNISKHDKLPEDRE